jgi:hypothetical protein
MNLPNNVRLGDLLSEEQLDECLRLIKATNFTALREYLFGFRQELEIKGVNSDYLAYYLEYLFSR